MQVTPRHLEANRLRSKLDLILEKYSEMDLSEDAPFVIYLTERMLGDIEECRRGVQRDLRQRATWPSLN